MSDRLPYTEDSEQDPNDMENSNNLFEELAAEEPSIEVEDTNPSATKPRPAVHLPGSSSGVMGVAMLVIALVMIIAAGVIFLTDTNSDDAELTPNNEIVQRGTDAPPPTETQVIPTNTPPPTIQVEDSNPNSRLLSTAAADEQLLALLTPIPASNSDQGAIGRDNAPFTEQIGPVQDSFVNYTVQSGDTLDGIEQRFGVDLCTIVWSNERNKVSPLRPGNQIIIPPIDGVYAKIRETITIAQLAEQTGVTPDEIIDSPYNEPLLGAKPDSILVEGIQVMVPGGHGGNCNIWGEKPVVSASGDTSGGSASNGSYSLWGCTGTVTGAAYPTTNPMGGRYEFFQSFSPSHTGVDLSSSAGTPVLAAGSGTVVFAGWNQYGYGNTIVIAHGTTFTLYGHLSSIQVRCAQTVSAGQTIGSVGSTGRSSGPHLHFEIRDAGFNPVNPIFTIPF